MGGAYFPAASSLLILQFSPIVFNIFVVVVIFGAPFRLALVGATSVCFPLATCCFPSRPPIEWWRVQHSAGCTVATAPLPQWKKDVQTCKPVVDAGIAYFQPHPWGSKSRPPLAVSAALHSGDSSLVTRHRREREGTVAVDMEAFHRPRANSYSLRRRVSSVCCSCCIFLFSLPRVVSLSFFLSFSFSFCLFTPPTITILTALRRLVFTLSHCSLLLQPRGDITLY